ncbi:MAG: YdcF family protein [Clostridiales bacterium]|nr:YdcF family protein [Clostridiales bacterium]
MNVKTRVKIRLIIEALAFLLAGGLLCFDTLFVLTRSSPNLGVLLPMILGLPLVVIGLTLPLIKKLCKKRRAARALMLALSIAYLAFALLFSVTTALILKNSSMPEDGADALIVLGGGIRGTSPTLTLKYRLDAAYDYLERNPDTTAVVSGGKGPDEAVSEASVMYEYLVRRGIAKERILVEDASTSTKENFEFSQRLIESELGEGKRTVFVTTRFHVFRSERTAKRIGLEAEGVPAKGVWYLVPNDYLRECLAIVGYFLMGRL